MLQTKLPPAITTVEEAKKLLTDLYNNSESFCPEDDANDCLSGMVTKKEGDQLNKLMNDIYNLPGNAFPYPVIDPCGFLLELDPDYVARVKADEEEERSNSEG